MTTFTVSWYKREGAELSWNVMRFKSFQAANKLYRMLSFDYSVAQGALTEYEDGIVVNDYVFINSHI